VGTFLLVVNDDHASILHGYGDMGPRKFWGHDLSCVFHQLTGQGYSTRLHPYCLIWTLIVQLDQPRTRSA